MKRHPMVCLSCGTVKLQVNFYYAAHLKKCDVWLGGCHECFENKTHAKNATKAHIKTCGGCMFARCEDCMTRSTIRIMEHEIRFHGWEEGENN